MQAPVVETAENFPKFLVLESLSEEPLTKLNPFIVEKQLHAIIGHAKSVRKLRNDCLLVEVSRKGQAESLLKVKEFFNIPAKCSPHSTLNTSKGVVRCPDLDGTSEEEIARELKPQNVSHVKRVIITKEGKKVNTNTYIVTFSTPVLPTTLRIGYMRVKVDLYIPNPMQCYRCFKFGHNEIYCTNPVICRRCSTAHQNKDACSLPPLCSNCKGDHYATSRTCPKWQFEKEVLRVKYTQSVSFPEARKIVQSAQQKPQGQSYASAASQHVQMVDCAVQVDLCDCGKSSSSLVNKQPQSASVQTESLPTNKQCTPKKPTQTQASKSSSPEKASQGKTAPAKPSSSEKVSQRNAPKERIQLTDRVKKAMRDPVATFNRFDHLRDVESMEDEDLGLSPPETSPTPSRCISPVKFPK